MKDCQFCISPVNYLDSDSDWCSSIKWSRAGLWGRCQFSIQRDSITEDDNDDEMSGAMQSHIDDSAVCKQ